MNCIDSERLVVKPYVKGNPVTRIGSSFTISDTGAQRPKELYLPDTIK